jgi:hypothetical protein
MTTEELVAYAGQLIERYDDIRVVGSGWSGNTRDGFAFNADAIDTGGGSLLSGGIGGGPHIEPPPVTTPWGACCLTTDNSCSILSASACAPIGTYQGDFTGCLPDPCVPACPCGASFTNAQLPTRHFLSVSLSINNIQDDVPLSCAGQPDTFQCRSYYHCQSTTNATGQINPDCSETDVSGNAQEQDYAAFCSSGVCPGATLISTENRPFTIHDNPYCSGCGATANGTCSASGTTVTCEFDSGINHFIAIFTYSNECHL